MTIFEYLDSFVWFYLDLIGRRTHNELLGSSFAVVFVVFRSLVMCMRLSPLVSVVDVSF